MTRSRSRQLGAAISTAGPFIEVPLRKCTSCSATKTESAFYKNKGKTMSSCKECVKSKVRAHYAENRERIAAYERERAQRPERKAMVIEYQRKRIGTAERTARSRVSNALRDGRLVRQPCEVCQATARVQAHHDDYSKPLDVRWLCFTHHREHHGQTVTAATHKRSEAA